MKTFDGDKNLKNELLTKLKHHQDLDTFIQGKWLATESGKVKGNGFKGCFYGCTMQTEDKPRELFSEKYSIDLWYCYLTENIFENLPKGEYEKFPLSSIDILPVGKDMNKLKSLFNYKNLENQLQFCREDKRVTKAILQCMELFKTDFDKIDRSAAESAARSAAELAARSAAESAARSAAELAARSAAWSAWSAARSAARSAESAESAWSAAESAESAARSAARSAKYDYYVHLKNLLFECIKETML